VCVCVCCVHVYTWVCPWIPIKGFVWKHAAIVFRHPADAYSHAQVCTHVTACHKHNVLSYVLSLQWSSATTRSTYRVTFCDFRPEWHFFFSLTSKKTQTVGEDNVGTQKTKPLDITPSTHLHDFKRLRQL
jgi:hypothetical protein